MQMMPMTPDELPSLSPALAGASATALVAAQSRESSMLQMAMLHAVRFPRDEGRCRDKIVEACKRPELLMGSGPIYSFPRGDATVTGPGIKLVRVVARRWSHLWYAADVTETTPTEVSIAAWALDLETCNYATVGDRMRKVIQRKKKGVTVEIPAENERDLRELVFRRMSVIQRRALLEIVPEDVVELAMETVSLTEKLVAQKNPESYRRHIESMLARYGVTDEIVAAALGKPVRELDADGLREAYRRSQRLQNGDPRSAVFPEAVEPEPEPAPDAPPTDLEALKRRMAAASTAAPETASKPAAAPKGTGKATAPAPAAQPAPAKAAKGAKKSPPRQAELAPDLDPAHVGDDAIDVEARAVDVEKSAAAPFDRAAALEEIGDALEGKATGHPVRDDVDAVLVDAGVKEPAELDDVEVQLVLEIVRQA